ncbi:MAG: AbrB/MazE/SpoVT family DNA-binding domain-containing protein [Planctomycetes bacterium]|nr:AbrB/MazE/SpoVT family DNA-binding domain-containing protein [Planctomycetota bacterium]MBM4083772.1 AbrB/MazE/SpoVT family DNA-binding domain-containing protein [Planctomycetota bacterium]
MEASWVTSKGQLVIPAKIRRRFNIKKGTRVNFIEQDGRIVLQPVTREYIRSFRGIFKLRPGEKRVTQELIEEHAEEVRREEEKIARHGF